MLQFMTSLSVGCWVIGCPLRVVAFSCEPPEASFAGGVESCSVSLTQFVELVWSGFSWLSDDLTNAKAIGRSESECSEAQPNL
jgi:hypothetical protein